MRIVHKETGGVEIDVRSLFRAVHTDVQECGWKKRGFGVGALLWFGVVEADAARLWITQYGLFAAKSRRARADFPGAKIILDQISSKPARRRVGFLSKGPPARGASTSLCSLKKITSVPSFFLFFLSVSFFILFFTVFEDTVETGNP